MNSEDKIFMMPFYEILPNYWSKGEDYSNILYTKPIISYSQLIDESHDNQNFINEISRLRPNRIERLENPYMFGRYLFRKENFSWTNRNEEIKEDFQYHPLASEDVSIVAEYGCDYRRYISSIYNQKNDKNPKFYSSLSETHNIKQPNQTVIVVVRVLSIGTKINKPYYDNDYYPQYFLYY